MAFDGLLLSALWADVEPDPPEIKGRRPDRARMELTWRGIEEIIPAVRAELGKYEDDGGDRPKVTWCLRADEGIARAAGRPDYLFSQFEDLWSEARSQGDELGWRPYLQRFHPPGGGRGREDGDRDRIKEMLAETWTEVRRHGVRACRLGLDYADHGIINLMNELGLAVDGTAQPGVYGRAGGNRQVFDQFGRLARYGQMKTTALDWRGAPQRPYHPAAENIRAPGRLGLLEVPNTMILTRRPLTRASYLVPWNILLRQPGLETRLHRLLGAGSPAVLSGFFHPTKAYDLLSRGAGLRRGLTLAAGSRYLGLGLRHLRGHMEKIFAVRKRYNYRLKFVTAGELRRYF